MRQERERERFIPLPTTNEVCLPSKSLPPTEHLTQSDNLISSRVLAQRQRRERERLSRFPSSCEVIPPEPTSLNPYPYPSAPHSTTSVEYMAACNSLNSKSALAQRQRRDREKAFKLQKTLDNQSSTQTPNVRKSITPPTIAST